MVTKVRFSWLPRIGAVTLWALAGAGAVMWGLRLSAPLPQAPLPAIASPQVMPELGGIKQLLGAVTMAGVSQGSATGSASSAGVTLSGVVATSRSGQGMALLTVGSQPPRAFKIGEEVRPGLVLQSVEAETVRLGSQLQSAATETLHLPQLRRSH